MSASLSGVHGPQRHSPLFTPERVVFGLGLCLDLLSFFLYLFRPINYSTNYTHHLAGNLVKALDRRYGEVNSLAAAVGFKDALNIHIFEPESGNDERVLDE